MKTLVQAASGTTYAGHPLPDIAASLSAKQVRPRRGQLAMIAGQPGAGKSMLTLWYAVRENIPALYLSADTDDYTTITRAAAMISGRTLAEIEEMVDIGEDGWVLDQIAGLDNVRFSFDPSPTLDDLDGEIKAFDEVWGEPPHLVIVDNLMNVVAEQDNEWAGMREIMKALHHVAHTTGAAVWVLHHTSENEGRPTLPPPRKAIQGKVSQLPEMILTVAMDPDAGSLHVACVKNRSGAYKADGSDFTTLFAVPERMALYEDYHAAQRARQRYW
jgi:RecA-family ATPase